MGPKKAAASIGIAILVCGGGYIGYRHFFIRAAFPPTSNQCFEMLKESLTAAKSNNALTVPDFSFDSVGSVKCVTAPGMITFTIAGTDSLGKTFRIYETAGGRAASGADSILDYCYLKDGEMVSQVRVTGREGKHSTGTCSYDASAVPNPAYSYTYGY